MTTKTDAGWNPYVAGSLTGLLIVISVLLTGNYFGASTSFSKTAGKIVSAISKSHAESLDYYNVVKPIIDWQWMFVIGIFLGGLISSLTSGSFRLQGLPELWEGRFGKNSHVKRALVAFFGGILMLFGARLAGGCTSGHGLSGSLQLAVSGLLTLTFMFAGGIITSRIIYKRGSK